MTGKTPKILTPVDGSDNSLRAVRRAIEVTKLGQAGEIHLLNVQPPLPGSVVTFIDKPTRDDYHREEADKALAGARKLLKKSGVAFDEHICVGDPGASIVAFSKRLGIDQVIMGTHGLGAALQLVLGSVAQDVVRGSKVPVTVVK
jgi:nucleotide-binding universal stress UspA family protein